MQRRTIVIVALIVLLVVVIVTQAAVLLQPRPQPTSTTAAAAIDWAAVAPGADASWPVCTPPSGTKRTLPLAESPAFVVVGINDGLPGTTSACIARELAWADTATGGSSQPDLAYYVMAADPWAKAELRWVPHPAWPSSNRIGDVVVQVPDAFASKRHGTTCTGGRTERACAYVYGWATARKDAAIEGLRDPAGHRFWIDVEATRDWSRDTLFNQAVVEGMVAGFTAPVAEGGVGTTTGIYSDFGEWAEIIGLLRPDSPLDALDEWVALGRVSKPEAAAALEEGVPLTPGGRVVMVQYLDGAIDRDLAAPAR